MTQTATCPAEATTIDARLTELVGYDRAVAALLVSHGVLKVEDRDCLAGIRDRIERQVAALRLAEETDGADNDTETDDTNEDDSGS